MNAVNYQKLYERTVAALGGRRPKLLLHVCCGPCAAACLEELSARFDVTIFFYNPNIAPAAEYDRRLENARRLVEAMPLSHPVRFLAGEYHPEDFLSAVKGLEGEPEGGARCACAPPRAPRRRSERNSSPRPLRPGRARAPRRSMRSARLSARRRAWPTFPRTSRSAAGTSTPSRSAPHTASIARTTAAARFPTAARRSIKNKEGTTAPSLFSQNMRARDYSARMRSASAWAARSCMARPG